MTPPISADIQGNIVEGYDLAHSLHVFCKIKDARKGIKFLSRVARIVTTHAEWKSEHRPASSVNLGMSYAALRRLGLGGIASDQRAFSEGMKARARLLSDELADWDASWCDGSLDLWIPINASTRTALADSRETIKRLGDGLVEYSTYELPGDALLNNGRRYEHFGFRDGISNPVVDGFARTAGPGTGMYMGNGKWRPIPLGEFLLGHRDHSGAATTRSTTDMFLRNGTFVVFRKLRQDVAQFRSYIHRSAARVGWKPDELAAKLVGRTYDGIPLTGLHSSIDGFDQAENEFGFFQDRDGARCPLGAHIRRVNPRDHERFPELVARHRIIRRGMPYGPALPEGVMRDDGNDRGLLFIAVNAHIERQFEFVHRHWINDGASTNQARDRDPVTGAHEPTSDFAIQGDRRSGRLPAACLSLPKFVTCAGGNYFFMPGLNGLHLLIAHAELLQAR
jgi:Dyp-type peroxidase family